MQARTRVIILCIAFLSAALTACAQVSFTLVARKTIESRLQSYSDKQTERKQALVRMFDEAGCNGQHFREQPVKHVMDPNLICELPGTGDFVVVVGAHYDFVDAGSGVADNWSGASLLPSLYESLKTRPHKHTYLFVAFSAEEQGLLGSEFYAKNLTKEERARIHAMVNLDTLGLGPTKIWVSRSDKKLVSAVLVLAAAMKLSVTGVNFEKVGSTDLESFITRKIPGIAFHSVTQQTLRILHSPRDNIKSIRMDDYFDSYRLMAGYLTYLDQLFEPPKPSEPAKSPN